MQYQYYFVMIIISVLASTFSFTAILLPDANASGGLNKSIGIAYSKTCKIMIQNNFTHTCPMPIDLYTLDTSNKKISGGFIIQGNWIERVEPTLEHHFRFYDFEKDWNIFFEPPGDMRDRIRMIYIENNFKQYFIPGESFSLKVNEDINSIVYGVIRYTDSTCKNITIGTDNFDIVFPDTLQYLRHGCDSNYSYLDTKVKTDYKKSFQDITTSQKYKDEQRLKYIKENCLKEYGVCNE